MKKLNLLGLMILAFIAGACESELEKDLAAQEAELNDKMLSSLAETRAGNGISPLLVPGEQVGVIVECDGVVQGPLSFTLNNNINGTIEPVPVIDPTSEHNVYSYFPYAVNTSNDPTKIEVTPIKAVQTQYGNGDTSAISDCFYISPSNSYYAGESPRLLFANAFTNFHFHVSANVDGIVVSSIEVKAPDGKDINFTSAYVNGTYKTYHTEFANLYGIQGGTSKTILNIENGGLTVPNSTTDYEIAYMNICPFNSKGEKLTVTVKTTDNETYTFEINGEDYGKGYHYIIPLHIEKEDPKPVIKNIRVLSLCEVGCLGTYDNTKQWNCYYGALNGHAKEIRRLLFEYFGKGKLVETGVISFTKTDTKCLLNKMKDSDLDKYNIIYLNNNARPTAELSARIMAWLNRSKDRVLMLAYDWKDPCVTPTTKESTVICKTTTNYLMFKHQIQGVTPHWYNSCFVNKSIGNYGAARSRMLVPFELNERTKYFWKEGPFKTNLNEGSDQRYWIEDCWWGSANVTDPNVIPLITYRDAKNDCYHHLTHKYGAGDKGMVLGVDPTKRIVYIGDSEIFSTVCVGTKQKDARMAKRDGCKPAAGLNNYSKIMGNLWAWMIQEVIQKP